MWVCHNDGVMTSYMSHHNVIVYLLDSSGESQYESAIRFYSELERKSATRLQSPLSDLYVSK